MLSAPRFLELNFFIKKFYSLNLALVFGLVLSLGRFELDLGLELKTLFSIHFFGTCVPGKERWMIRKLSI